MIIKLKTMFKKIIHVAIDSPAASGAGTQAKLISKYFNLYYLDTGKLYRILGKLYLKNKKKIDYPRFKIKILNTRPIDLINNSLLKTDIGMAAAFLAKNKKIRKLVDIYQKKIAHKIPKKFNGICLDGRDITYNILPNADFKFFMTASVNVRSKRRFNELKKLNHIITYSEVLKGIKERDKSDITRKIAPLKKTKDSFLINTTNLNIDETFKKIKKIILQK